jgi:hypothetical protein
MQQNVSIRSQAVLDEVVQAMKVPTDPMDKKSFTEMNSEQAFAEINLGRKMMRGYKDLLSKFKRLTDGLREERDDNREHSYLLDTTEVLIQQGAERIKARVDELVVLGQKGSGGPGQGIARRAQVQKSIKLRRTEIQKYADLLELNVTETHEKMKRCVLEAKALELYDSYLEKVHKNVGELKKDKTEQDRRHAREKNDRRLKELNARYTSMDLDVVLSPRESKSSKQPGGKAKSFANPFAVESEPFSPSSSSNQGGDLAGLDEQLKRMAFGSDGDIIAMPQ